MNTRYFKFKAEFKDSFERLLCQCRGHWLVFKEY